MGVPELSSFGASADFYLFCADRWEDISMKDEHYLLRRVNSLRNGAAHSSAMINGLGVGSNLPSGRTTEMVSAALDKLGVPRKAQAREAAQPPYSADDLAGVCLLPFRSPAEAGDGLPSPRIP